MDTTYSDLLLMIGGQILLLFMIIVVVVFGVKPLSDPLRTLTGQTITSLVPKRNNK